MTAPIRDLLLRMAIGIPATAALITALVLLGVYLRERSQR